MNAELQKLITAQKKKSFTNPSAATNEDALGILVAHHFEWDGLAILKTFYSALEDANFHSEASDVAEMIEENEAS